MKLYLSSVGLKNSTELYNLIEKSKGIKTALITNAIDLKSTEDRRVRYDLIISELKKLSLELTDINLGDYIGNTDGLKKELRKYDFVWVSGGNVFYLRQIMKRSGFDKIIKELVNSGLVYGGDSAGALVICPSLEGLDLADPIDKVEEVIYEGIGLVDFIPLPHWGNEKFKDVLPTIKTGYVQKGYEVEVMNDTQGIIVEDKTKRLIGEK